jgi:hypothetical protein
MLTDEECSFSKPCSEIFVVEKSGFSRLFVFQALRNIFD